MRKTMLCCLLAVFALMVVAGAGVAHPPSDLILSYNAKDGMLTVNAPHSVGDGKNHYIEEFNVWVGGEKFYMLHASLQIDNKASVAIFHVGELAAGAVVEVEAKCSRIGSLKNSLTIE